MRKIILFLSLVWVLGGCDSSLTQSDFNQNSSSSKMSSNSNNPEAVQKTIAGEQSDLWVSAYLASYRHLVPEANAWGNLPTDEIKWDAFTHLFYFTVKTNGDGTFRNTKPGKNMSPGRIEAIVEAAHNHDKPILFTIGGWKNRVGFKNAIKPANRSQLVETIVDFMNKWGFDGVDLDKEPVEHGEDARNYKAFVNELKEELGNHSTPLLSDPLLTASTGSHPSVFAELQEHFDQINVMAYNLSGPWPGWRSWHNAALTAGDVTYPINDKPIRSVDNEIQDFLDAGIKKEKMGLGVNFHGFKWTGGSGTSSGGVTKPEQTWENKPWVQEDIPYFKVMNQYYTSSRANWDEVAQVPYLSIDKASNNNDQFISYANPRSIRAKMNFIKEKGLGGAMIWEIGSEYQQEEPRGKRHKLLNAVIDGLQSDGSSGDDSNNSGDNESSSAKYVFEDKLKEPWINASWNVTADFDNSNYQHKGSNSIKVEKGVYGGFSLNNGGWNDSKAIGVDDYNALKFAVYVPDKNGTLSVRLQNSNGDWFPRVFAGDVQQGNWKVFSVSLDKLNPDNKSVNRVSLLEKSGESKTMYYDGIRFVK